ncbi:MAG: hypothetical protein AAFQ91_22145, partial [Cyanobacteria bacterium J06621_15]
YSEFQNSTQNTVQDGTAINGSVNAQSSESLSVQDQARKIRKGVGRGGRYGRYGRYGRPGYCRGSYSAQAQNSSQGTVQSGVAVDHSDNAQSNSSVSDQKQTAAKSHVCR